MKTYFDFENATYSLYKGPSKNLLFDKSTKLVYSGANLVLPKFMFCAHCSNVKIKWF